MREGWYYFPMMKALQEIETLSVPERVQIVEDLWDSIARSNATPPVLQWQKDELARRKQRYPQNPDSGHTWDQVKRSILQARRQRPPSCFTNPRRMLSSPPRVSRSAVHLQVDVGCNKKE